MLLDAFDQDHLAVCPGLQDMQCLHVQWTFDPVHLGPPQPGRGAPEGSESPSLRHSSEKLCARGSLEQ